MGARVMDGGAEGMRVMEGGILEGVGLEIARVGVRVIDLVGVRVEIGALVGVIVTVDI